MDHEVSGKEFVWRFWNVVKPRPTSFILLSFSIYDSLDIICGKHSDLDPMVEREGKKYSIASLLSLASRRQVIFHNFTMPLLIVRAPWFMIRHQFKLIKKNQKSAFFIPSALHSCRYVISLLTDSIIKIAKRLEILKPFISIEMFMKRLLQHWKCRDNKWEKFFEINKRVGGDLSSYQTRNFVMNSLMLIKMTLLVALTRSDAMGTFATGFGWTFWHLSFFFFPPTRECQAHLTLV